MNPIPNSKLRASLQPEADILKVAYKGQEPERRMYRSGYEHYLNRMPHLQEGDPLLDAKVSFTKMLMQSLAGELSSAPWIKQMAPEHNGFKRTIIAMEPPNVATTIQEGTELVVAHWGEGHTSPVHGHADGYMHEEVLYGRMRVNTYRITDAVNRIVRPLETTIFGRGTFASQYSHPNPIKRANLVHNFTAIEPSATLHYLPEHTRDGRDNRFAVEFFDDNFYYGEADVERITSAQGMYLQVGDVALVRSINVPAYGDHYIVVTGPPVMKEHGLRVQDIAIHAPTSFLLDMYKPQMGLTLLKLKPRVQQAFLEFHGMQIVNGKFVRP